MYKGLKMIKLSIALLLLTVLLPTSLVNAQATEEADVGKLTIHKYEREPGVADGEAGNGNSDQNLPDDAVKLPGVTFEFTQTHAFDPATDRWSEVDGDAFTHVTDLDGEIVIDNIDLGRYKVQEISGPDHVNINTDEYFVDIPMTNVEGRDVNYDVHIYPKNETIRGAVELRKFDGETEATLAGVTFNLYNADGSLLKEGLQTNADGKIQVDGLAFGSYYFAETATIDGYVLGSQRVEFDITASGLVSEDGSTEGTVVSVQVANFDEPEIEKEVDKPSVNRGEEVTYTLTTELPADIADYKTYAITDELDNRLSYLLDSWEVTGVDADAITFTQEGQKLVWEINDFAAFAGVDEIVISFDAQIAEDAPMNEVIDNKATLEFENKHGNGGEKETTDIPVIPTAGTLTLIKQDGDSEERLAGAVFELRNADGEVIHTATTNGDGIIDFGELDFGNYTIHETKAPADYRKLTKPIDVSVDAESVVQEITVDNFKSGWNLPKTGGMGTVLFTATGLILIGFASLLLFRRKKDIVS